MLIGPAPAGGDPFAVITPSDNVIKVFVVGADGALWLAGQTAAGSGYGTWQSLGGPGGLVGQPTTLVNDDGGVFVYTRQSSGRMWGVGAAHEGDAITGWIPISSAPPVTLGDPMVVITRQDNVMKLFAIGSDGGLWLAGQSAAGAAFSSWQSLGGPGGLVGRPWALVNKDGGVVVYAGTSSGQLWGAGAGYEGDTIGGWTQIGTSTPTLTGDPVMIRNTDNTMTAFATTADGVVWVSGQSTPGGLFGTWFAR